MPPADVFASLPADQQKTLAVFACHAFGRGGDWQEITFKLPGQALPTIFKRDQLEGLVVQQADSLAQTLPQVPQTALKEQIKDIKTHAAEIGQQLLEAEINPQPLSPQAQMLKKYQAHLTGLTSQIGSGQPIIIPSVEKVKTAAQANEQLQQKTNVLKEAVTQNLQSYYPEELKKQKAAEINQLVTQKVIARLEQNQELTEDFAKQTVKEVQQSLSYDAAIKSTGGLVSGLNTAFRTIAPSPEQKQSLTSAYNQLRNFEMTIDFRWWQTAEQLASAGLNIQEVNKTIAYLEQNQDRISSAWEMEHYLRQELGRYPQLESKKNSLASQISLQLSIQKGSNQAKILAQKMKANQQAIQAYCVQSITVQELKDKGLVGLAAKVEELAKNPQLQKLHQKTFKNREKTEKQVAKKVAKLEKNQQRRQYLATHKIGLLLAPRMRTGMLLNKSAAWRGLKNFAPKVTPGYWINTGNRWFRKAVGNWLIKKGLSDAGQAFIGAGVRGLLKNALIKMGLGSLFGGPVGAAIGIGATILSAAALILKNENLRNFVGSMLAGIGYLIYYLITQLPFTFLFSSFGLSLFGPPGLLLGGIGFAVDKAIGGLSGLGKAFGSALPQTASAAQTAASITTQASFLSVGNLTTVSVLSAVAGPLVAATFTTFVLVSAFALPSEGGIGGGTSGPQNVVQNPTGDHLALKIAEALKPAACGGSKVTQVTWNQAKICLEKANIPQSTIEEMRHSVFDLANNTNLQCVGFKIGVEKALGVDLPRQNAVAFLDSTKSSGYPPKTGDNAVWGPRDECPTQDPVQADQLCQTNAYCCGHIGIVTAVGSDGSIEITSAWGDSGSINTISFPAGAEKSDGAPWQYLKR